MALLEVRDLRRSFYGVAALRGVDLAVEPHTITGLIGPNGAGKTTLFNCVSGLLAPDDGAVRFDGIDITHLRPDQIARRGLTRTFQIARGCPRLTVMENLLLYGPGQPGEALVSAMLDLAGGRRRERALVRRALEIAERLNLRAAIDQPASELSGGQKKLLELGRALMAEPRMILLDEPIAGVNRVLAREIGEHLRRLRAEGVTFLVIEHHMDTIARLCDPVVVMADGRRLAQGRFAEIAENRDVQEAYMGRRAWAS